MRNKIAVLLFTAQCVPRIVCLVKLFSNVTASASSTEIQGPGELENCFVRTVQLLQDLYGCARSHAVTVLVVQCSVLQEWVVARAMVKNVSRNNICR